MNEPFLKASIAIEYVNMMLSSLAFPLELSWRLVLTLKLA